MDWLHILMLFGVGAVAGFINVNAGGGSSLTLPALYFLGLDWAEANGTNRIALILQNIFAVASFKKRGVFAFKSSLHSGPLHACRAPSSEPSWRPVSAIICSSASWVWF